MLRTIYGDKARYRQQYWSEFKGNYLTGDGARRDEDGYFWIVGRIDDVLNVAGHRLGTSEIESALVSHARVAEAAVVGRADELKGQAVVAFVTVKTGVDASRELKEELRDHVAVHIGAIAKPDEVRFAEALPKDAQRQNHAAASQRNRKRSKGHRRHHHVGGFQRLSEISGIRGGLGKIENDESEALSRELHPHRLSRDRIEGQAPADAHRASSREASSPKK